jgi:hypothetical protein
MANPIKKKKAPVSERALIQRINRKLGQLPNPEKLVAARGDAAREELGDFYTVEASNFGKPRSAVSSGVCLAHVKLGKLARELGVLQSWEELRD